jgi:hypothetical protein
MTTSIRPVTPQDRAWLAVADGNDRARRFYEREGWTDGGALDHIPAGAAVVVPCRRYQKPVDGSGS